MGKPFTIVPGQVVHLPTTWDNGLVPPGPAQMPANIQYSAEPIGLVALTPTSVGVDVLGVLPIPQGGKVTVKVTGQGAVALSDTSVGTAPPLPLAGAIHLNA